MSGHTSSASSPIRPKGADKNGVNACLACRKIKMKCKNSGNNDTCDRCAKKSLTCVHEKHRRGRKPASRRSQAPSLVSTEAVPTDDGVPRVLLSARPASAVSPSNMDASRNRTHGERLHQDNWGWALLEGFRSSGPLNKQAMTGKLSLENITHGQNHIDRLAISDVPQFIQADDPIEKGIVNHTIAVALYSTFMRDLNKYICQFDPALHTFDYVRRSSPFLLTAMLAASAKAFKSTSHSGLLNHAEDLLATCFRKGKKSVDIVQAILVLTYWKEPDDTRAWLSVGYVIRMCIELGLHKITPSSQDKDADRDELSIRERRNVERLWLLLYFYDRSLSLQNGSPSMIRRNELIESANTWFDDPWATSHDRLLCALVTLRLIGSEVFDLLNPHRNSSQNTMLDRTDGLMGTFQHDITRWKSRWSSMEESRNDSLYQFFIAFYGTNLRLLFSLFPLHASLTSSLPEESIDKQPLLVSFSSAVEMLQLLARPDYSELLYLVQDSINIMIAYSSIFLIKLLLSVSPEIRSEIEGPAIEAISGASKVFDAQNAPPHSGCGLQAKFLRNVLKVFRKAHKPRQGRSTQPIQTSTQTTSNTNTSIHEVRSDMDLAVGEMLDPTVYNTDHAVGLDYLLDWSEPSFANFDLWPTLSVGANSDMNGTFSLDGLGHMGPFT